MGLLFVFLFGIGNFAVHKAVIESGHPLLGTMPWHVLRMGGRVSFGIEFVMLSGTMLMVSQGPAGWAWFYAAYSAMNALAAWLILSRRI
jgi:hypothetical protein